MISKDDKKTIQVIAKKYNAKRVLLFGSCLSSEKDSRDIDIAVEGIKHKYFFSFYGDLITTLTKPVDLIDLSGTSKFVKMIKKEGVLLYG